MDNKILIEQSQHWEKSFSSKPEMFGSEPSHSAKIALENFEKSLKINARNYSTLYNKSLTHFELKQIKKACIDLKKSIKLGKEVFKEEYSKICFKNF